MQRLVIEAREDGLTDVRRERCIRATQVSDPNVQVTIAGHIQQRYLTSADTVNTLHPSVDRVKLLGDWVDWGNRRDHEDCQCFSKPHQCPVHGDDAYRELTLRH